MKPFSSSEALAIIANKAGKELDPTLSAIFAEVIGVMPEAADQEQSGEMVEVSAEAQTPEEA
jgi:HD-GYP domain-containing protein (c-di-GMP phosphodiesterase class II)